MGVLSLLTGGIACKVLKMQMSRPHPCPHQSKSLDLDSGDSIPRLLKCLDAEEYPNTLEGSHIHDGKTLSLCFAIMDVAVSGETGTAAIT